MIDPLYSRARKLQGALAAIFKLMDSQDPVTVSVALELMLQGDEPLSELFDQCGVNNMGEIIRWNRLVGNSRTRPALDALLVYQLSIAPKGSRGAEIRKKLKSLSIELSRPVDIIGFNTLEVLDIKLASGFVAQDLTWIGALPALYTLNIVSSGDYSFSNHEYVPKDKIPSLIYLTGLQAPSLKRVHLASSDLSDLNGLATCAELTSLKLTNCDSLEKLDPIANFHALQELTIEQCDQIVDLSPLAGLNVLERLSLKNCTGIQSLSPAGDLSGLKHLEIVCVLALTEVDFVAPMPSLLTVAIKGQGPQRLNGLVGATSLTSVTLCRCTVITLEPLTSCEALDYLEVFDCAQLADLKALEKLKSVRTLELDLRGSGIRDLTPLAGMTNLSSLHLNGAGAQSVSYAPLGQIGALRTLIIHGAPGLKDINVVASLGQLEKLVLEGCEDLNDLSGLLEHRSLVSVEIDFCDAVHDVTPLCTLPSLKNVSMSGVSRPKGLKRLQSVNGLEIRK